MQEAYFRARKTNVEDELFGDENSQPKVSVRGDSVNAPETTPKKPNKSKQTLLKILEEEKGSTTSSKLPRSKSGFLMPYKSVSFNPEPEVSTPANLGFLMVCSISYHFFHHYILTQLFKFLHVERQRHLETNQ